MKRGKFIVFEGIDGSGKSTQIKLLSKYLQEKGVPCYVTCEPTEGPVGALIRQCLTGRIEADEKTIAGLFVADRLDHLYNARNGIIRKLEEGVCVISDRYYFSSYAYHGVHLPMDWVVEANRLSAEALRADLTLFIDIEPKRSLERVSRRGETERYEKLENMTRVREKYLEAFETFGAGERIAVVQSDEDKERTQTAIRTEVDKLF